MKIEKKYKKIRLVNLFIDKQQRKCFFLFSFILNIKIFCDTNIDEIECSIVLLKKKKNKRTKDE